MAEGIDPQSSVTEQQTNVPKKSRISRRTALWTGIASAGALLVGGGVSASMILRDHTPPVPTLSSPRLIMHLGKYQRTFGSRARLLAWSPDGSYLAEALDGRLKSWNVVTGHQILTYTFPASMTLFANNNPFCGITWSPNSHFLAASQQDYGTVMLWNAQTGARLSPWPHSGFLTVGVSWSPDSIHLATGGDRVYTWDLAKRTFRALIDYSEVSHMLASVAWSPDGRSIAAMDQDPGIESGATVKVWDAQSGTRLFRYTAPMEDFVGDLAWAPDGQRLAIGLTDIDPYTSESLTESLPLLIWNVSTHKQLLACQGIHAGILNVTWSPDGTRVAASGADNTVQVWDATTGKRLLVYKGHTQPVTEVAWSPDGKLIASGGYDNTVQVWDAPARYA